VTPRRFKDPKTQRESGDPKFQIDLAIPRNHPDLAAVEHTALLQLQKEFPGATSLAGYSNPFEDGDEKFRKDPKSSWAQGAVILHAKSLADYPPRLSLHMNGVTTDYRGGDAAGVYYLRRRNLGNYEHAEASVRFTVNDDAVNEALARAKRYAEAVRQLYTETMYNIYETIPAPALLRAAEIALVSRPEEQATGSPLAAAGPSASSIPPTTGIGAVRRVQRAAKAAVPADGVPTAEEMGHALQAKRKELPEMQAERPVMRARGKPLCGTRALPLGALFVQ